MDLTLLRQRLMHERKLVLNIRAVPKSSKTEWAGQMADGAYKLRVTSAPEKGKANDEIIHFLAAEFGIPRSTINLVAGASSQKKMIRIQLKRP